MKYNQYFVKKRFKGQAIDGYVNLPYGTICSVGGEFIFHEGKRVCATTSQNAFDYFWGYDPNNPKKEIERQELAYELYNSAPKEDGDTLSNKTNTWNNYGGLIEYAAGMMIWQWNECIFDLPYDKLKHLLDCVKKGVMPIV